MKERVVVTGIGAVTPLGTGKEVFWDSLIRGVSGIGKVTHFDASAFDCRIAGEVKDFNPADYDISKKDLRKMDRFLQFSVAAAKAALSDAGFEIAEDNALEIGVLIGSGIGGMATLESQHRALLEKGPGQVSPFFIPMMISNMASGQVGIYFGLKGPNFSIVTACATGAHCIGEAAELIRRGKARAMLAGGCEAAITPLAFAGFCSMRALSTRNGDPARASRPFDLERDGFVMAEGAGVLLLESVESALSRGAHIYAEIAGFGISADAHHITNPDPEGRGAAEAIRQAIESAGLTPKDIDYINAHGTSTPVGDKTEVIAIKKIFGEHASRVAVSSSKSMMGHALGAAGALESIVTILTVERNIIPPTINYEYPDPECDLDFVPNVGRCATVRYALNNSFGFGGQNAVLAIGKFVNSK